MVQGLEDVEDIWAIIKHVVTSAMDRFIPKVKLRSSQLPKWLSEELRHQYKCFEDTAQKI